MLRQTNQMHCHAQTDQSHGEPMARGQGMTYAHPPTTSGTDAPRLEGRLVFGDLFGNFREVELE